MFVTPEIRPFEGMQPPLAGAKPLPADGALSAAAAPGLLSRPAGLFDEIFEEVAEEVHERVLDEATDGDLGERAIRYCFPRDIDDLEEAVELYVRLGFGQSVESLLEERLEDLWRDARDAGRDLVDDVADEIDDVVDDLF